MAQHSYYIAGSNLFNQWLDDVDIITKFKVIKSKLKDPKFDFQVANLIQVNWWYNIVEFVGEWYISGNTKKKNLLKKINLPEECKKSPIIAGNDNTLIIGHQSTSRIWVINMSDDSVKELSLETELPVESYSKRSKLDNNLQRIVVNNSTCLYITQANSVYNGLIPSYVDTTHCEGRIVDVACGFEHYMLLTDAGLVYTWGESRRLQLGHGDVSPMETPTKIKALAGIKIVKIKAGGWHSFAVSEYGDLYTWGWNDDGQLGVKENDDKLKSYSLPKIVELYDDDNEVNLEIKDIGCGNKHSVLLLEDGSVWTTGCNKYGQLGIPHTQSSNYFRKACELEMENEYSFMCGPWTTVIVSK